MGQDIEDDRMEAMAMQGPRFGAQAMAYGGGAWMGRGLARRMGMRGRMGMVGMAAGALAMGASGIAEGLGNIADYSMMPMRETRQMGAAMQRMSQDWVVTGPQLHPTGRGLTREAGIEFGGAVRGLAGDEGFQQETGGMFNRQDLMQITRQGGRAGLFDMAQSVPQIKQQLRSTANTIRQFMELTNDPDVSNVIRQMGQLRQFGMTQQEMLTAAQGMRTFSRAAGTTIGGVQQMGGLPGAMTFQQAGLTPGAGFQYGNFAAASARQLVAGGGVNPRQLALLGGVSGIAQRDIQAQAAMGSMPLFGAAMSQYGPGGWGVNAGAVGQSAGGAFGMVGNAVQSMNQAVRQGGIGALATFPLAQREIQDEALSMMTPQQQMAQRFSMAMQTGQRLGLRGRGAFGAGARLLYGDEVATQMMQQASSPEFWQGQRQIIQSRQRELAYNQRQQILADAPMLGGLPRDIAAATGISGAIRGVGRAFGDIGEGIGEGIAGIGGVLGGFADMYRAQEARGQGLIRRQLRSGAGGAAAGLRGAALGGGDFSDLVRGGREGVDVDVGVGRRALTEAINLEERGGLGVQERAAGIPGIPLSILMGGEAGTVGEIAAAASAYARYGMGEEYKPIVGEYINTAARTLNIMDKAKQVGGREAHVAKASEALDKAMGDAGGGGAGYSVMRTAADKLDKIVVDRGKYGEAVTAADMQKVLVESIIEESGGKVNRSRAEQIAQGLAKKPHIMRDINAQITHYARQDSADPSTWLNQEGDMRTAVTEQITKATNARVEALQGQIETMEEKLDLDPFLGFYSGEEENVQKIAARRGGKRFALLAAASMAVTGDRDERTRSKLREVQKKYGFTDKEIRAAEREARAMEREDEDTMERIREAGAAGSLEDLERYGTQQQRIGIQSAFASEGFMGQFAPYSERLTEYMGTEGRDVTAAGIAKQFTQEDLGRMAQSGAGGRRWAAIMKLAQGTGEKAQKAQEFITRYAAQQARTTEEGVEEVAATKATGEEAQRLQESDIAMSDMQTVFSEFSRAAPDFAQGARMLREAMNSEMVKKMAEN